MSIKKILDRYWRTPRPSSDELIQRWIKLDQMTEDKLETLKKHYVTQPDLLSE